MLWTRAFYLDWLKHWFPAVKTQKVIFPNFAYLLHMVSRPITNRKGPYSKEPTYHSAAGHQVGGQQHLWMYWIQTLSFLCPAPGAINHLEGNSFFLSLSLFYS